MQSASAAFDRAVQAYRTWMPTRIRTDWADDGYDGDHTIDDLSPQVGQSWAVDHDLDDGYPNTVSFVSGTAIPAASTDLGGRTVAGVPKSAVAYWSPLRTDSPVYGYARDVADVTVDVGLVTDSGPEYVRVFTGQMVSTPLKGGKATLSAISRTRVALMKPVQPPAFSNIYANTIMSSWVISWCLFACGVYAGPSPRTVGTVAYYPMHGGTWRFHDGRYPNGNIVQLSATSEGWSVYDTTPTTSPTAVYDLAWVPGPYVAAPNLQLRTARSRRLFTTLIPLGSTTETRTDLMSQAASAGRLEFWVRGDAADYNTAPGGSATVSQLCGFRATTTAVGNPYVAMGLDVNRRAYVTVFDGTTTRTLTSTGTLPTDGGWYFVGAAFDAVADKLWVNLNGTVESSTPGTMLQSQFPATDSWYTTDGSPYLISYLPFSDLTLTTGVQANPDNYPLWRNDASFTPTATVGLTTNELTGVAEKVPREAWKIISDFAQSELAMMRCDEHDLFQYLPLGWWVKDAQQAVGDIISTRYNAEPFDVDFDPTRVRTSVKVSYTRLDTPTNSINSGIFRRTFELSATNAGSDEIIVNPGLNTFRFTFQNPVLYLYRNITANNGPFATADSASASASYITFNSAADGTGTEYSAQSTPPAAITITVTAWDPGGVTIQIFNATGVVLYMANNEQVPIMCLTGIPATVTQTYVQVGDDGGVRGERTLDVSAEGVQQETSARRLAQNLLNNLRRPMATIGSESSGITVTANPLRQPGDLVYIEDTETGIADSLWRLQSVRHKGDGASYTQEVVARQVYPIAVAGQAVVGQSLVGPSD